MAVGILEFNGTQVDLTKYKEFLSQYKPKGKDKLCIAQMINYAPLRVGGQAGKQMATKAGGRKGVMPFDTVHFPVEFDGKGNPSKTVEGVLRYYERKNASLHPMGMATYEPTRLRFQSGRLMVDGNNDALLLYLVCSGKNKENSARMEGNKEIGWSRIPAVWEIIRPGLTAEKNAKKLNEKFDAMQRVKMALANNQELAKQLYESKGHTDWEMYVRLDSKTKKWVGDFREIENTLMVYADSNPGEVIERFNDTALDIRSKIVVALGAGILAQEGDKWFWGNKAAGGKYADKPAADKQITKIPAGKGATKEAVIDWFCDFLKGEPTLMAEINVELDESKAAA